MNSIMVAISNSAVYSPEDDQRIPGWNIVKRRHYRWGKLPNKKTNHDITLFNKIWYFQKTI